MIRVTLNGFRCEKETWDDCLERDGKGDEIFVSWAAVCTLGGAQRTTPRIGMSNVYGDVNGRENRIQAGSRSDRGGIKTGDLVPGRLAFENRALPGTSVVIPWPVALPPWSTVPAGGFPITLWEGDLQPGDSLVVSPLLYEWDGESVNPGPVIGMVNDIARAVADVVCTVVFPPGVLISEAIAAVVAQVARYIGIAGDRPIGLDLGAPGSPDPNNPAGTNQGKPWPQLSFTGAMLPAMLAHDEGFGPGVFQCGQFDPPGIGGGVYFFYLQVARV